VGERPLARLPFPSGRGQRSNAVVGWNGDVTAQLERYSVKIEALGNEAVARPRTAIGALQ
jgi:hypothetical protein